MNENHITRDKILDMLEKDKINGRDLVNKILSKYDTPEKDVINLIIDMEDEEKIVFKETDVSPPNNISEYMSSLYAYWYWVINFISLLSMLILLQQNYDLTYIKYVLGSIFSMFLPGYCLSKIIFLNEKIGAVKTIAFSIGVSISMISLIGVLINYSPFGLFQLPLTIVEFVLILILSSIAVDLEYIDNTRN